MIKLKDVKIGFKYPLTNEVNININDGQWFGIIGKNGSGKSTLLKTILGIVKPLSGEIKVLNADPGKNNKFISYIPQEREVNLTDEMTGFSLIKNSYYGWGVNFNISKNNKKILELLELVGASEFMHQPFNNLSGGQKKRIYLVQALISDPHLLLLDEPLADLDPDARKHFILALKRIQEEKKNGLLIISHDMHEIASYLNGFIHFKDKFIHQCIDLPCANEDSYV